MDTILYMAPMQGVTNYIYRDVYFRYFKGYDIAVSPLIGECNATNLNNKVFNEVRPELNPFSRNISASGGEPQALAQGGSTTANVELIPQILGNNDQDFIQFSKSLFELGYKKVNWNLGCPFPMVRNKKRGSGLLPYPDLILKFLECVIPSIPNILSLKVRLGIKDNAPLYALLPLLNDFPLENIIIHPRTAIQLYGGQVDLDGFEKAIALTRHEIVYSGDIYTLKNFQDFSSRFSRINRWMLGRGGVIDPFLPERIKNLNCGNCREARERFKAFHDTLLEKYQQKLYGPAHLLHKMKELWSYWALSFENSRDVLKKILKVKTILMYHDAVKGLFDLYVVG
jgi:tRNA-dihydrouridine synthase